MRTEAETKNHDDGGLDELEIKINDVQVCLIPSESPFGDETSEYAGYEYLLSHQGREVRGWGRGSRGEVLDRILGVIEEGLFSECAPCSPQ